MIVFDLYCVSHESLGEARVAIEDALGVRLEARDSDYRGGLYFKGGGVGKESLTLQTNWDAENQEHFKMDYPDCAFILYVSYSPRSDEIRSALGRIPEIRHLWRRQEQE